MVKMKVPSGGFGRSSGVCLPNFVSPEKEQSRTSSYPTYVDPLVGSVSDRHKRNGFRSQKRWFYAGPRVEDTVCSLSGSCLFRADTYL